MKVFVVRLNPDPRDGIPYSKYLDKGEYKKIHEESVMDGFHEAVNYLSENGEIRGYLPPRHSKKMRNGEPFILISITTKTKKKNSSIKNEKLDTIVGLQAGCIYRGDEIERKGVPDGALATGLTWHYSCMESLSLPLKSPIQNARSFVLAKNKEWRNGPTREMSKAKLRAILQTINKNLDESERAKLKRIETCADDWGVDFFPEYSNPFEFEEEVENAMNQDLSKVKGNKFPNQIQVQTYQYERDPKVAAYALRKANGICDDCHQPAPFTSRKSRLPYLEVHHIKMLKDGGPDTIDNVIALCPNCHRRRHFGLESKLTHDP